MAPWPLGLSRFFCHSIFLSCESEPVADVHGCLGCSLVHSATRASHGSSRDGHPGNREGKRAAPLMTSSRHGDGWLGSDPAATSSMDREKNVCRRCRGVVGCGSIGWAAVVQRRTGGRRTQPTNQGMDRSGGKPLSNGQSLRRRSVIPVVRGETGTMPKHKAPCRQSDWHRLGPLAWLVAAPMPLVGMVVGMHYSMEACRRQVPEICGLGVLPYLFAGLVGGTLAGAIVGAVVGEVLAWLRRRRNRRKVESA